MLREKMDRWEGINQLDDATRQKLSRAMVEGAREARKEREALFAEAERRQANREAAIGKQHVQAERLNIEYGGFVISIRAGEFEQTCRDGLNRDDGIAGAGEHGEFDDGRDARAGASECGDLTVNIRRDQRSGMLSIDIRHK